MYDNTCAMVCWLGPLISTVQALAFCTSSTKVYLRWFDWMDTCVVNNKYI